MLKKLAKLKFLPNNFEVLENGDHVQCAISGKKIPLEKLNYLLQVWDKDQEDLNLIIMHTKIMA